MASRELNHWCDACNIPVWLNGPDPRCPYCRGPALELSRHYEDVYDVDLLPPSLAPHADIFMRAYHSIFGPTAPRDDYRSNHPIHRPCTILAPRSSHPIHERIPIGAPPMHRPSTSRSNHHVHERIPIRAPPMYRLSTSRSNHHVHERIPIRAPPMYRPSTSRSNHPIHDRILTGAPPMYRPSTARSNHPIHDRISTGAPPMYRPSTSRSNHPIHERIPIGAPYYQRNVDESAVGERHVNRQQAEDEIIGALMEASLHEEHHGPPPASESAIQHLPSIEVSEQHLNDEGKCPVCQEKFELNSTAKQMPCRHIFHPDCIIPWLERHNTCPVCRFELPTDRSTTSRMGRRLRSMNPLSRILPRLRSFRQ